MDRQVILVIPSFEPDQRLVELVQTIVPYEYHIVLVDDGSGEQYKSVFENVKEIINKKGTVLTYSQNRGKGYALKTGFKYVRENYPEALGVITVDSDGQHDIESINAVCKTLEANPDSLVLGVRSFDKASMPKANYLANRISNFMLRMVAGVKVNDSQTGLRGIPYKMLGDLLNIRENRFEFEMKMFSVIKKKYRIKEVGINLIYDSVDEHSTHFRPVRDTLRIAWVYFGQFIRYSFSSMSSAAIDVGLFAILCHCLNSDNNLFLLSLSNILARVVSSIYNFTINYLFVFNSKEKKLSSAIKYFVLVAIQMVNSTLLVDLFMYVLPNANAVVVKMMVDIFIFIANYFIQEKIVFTNNGRDNYASSEKA